MKTDSTDKLLEGVDLDAIVKKSLHSSGVPALSQLDESYVAQPKTYPQVSERVSQKTKGAHTELYNGYVEALNKTSAELDTADRAAAGPNKSTFRDLKLAEAFNANAVWLHELYFANCFDPHSTVYMEMKSYMRIERDWGTFDDWQRDFVACCLSAREGWAVMAYSMQLKRYINTVIDGHDQHTMLGLYPIVVLDVWSHAYYRDYLTDRASYVIAQMRELNWQVIEERVERAEKIAGVLK